MKLKSVPMEIPEGYNLILGHAHFIKTVEDLHEVMVGTSSQVNILFHAFWRASPSKKQHQGLIRCFNCCQPNDDSCTGFYTQCQISRP